MQWRRSRTVVASLALVGMGMAPPAATAAGGALGSFHPIPLAPMSVVHLDLSFPPTTAFCEEQIGIACYQPPQLQQAYDLNPLYQSDVNGSGETIVIVDAFGSPTIKHDLTVFDEAFDLPAPPNFKIISPAGAIPAYPADPFGKADRSSWALETSLDVEWAHAIAPGANILLVETPQSETEGVQGFPQIVQAENYVINHHLGQVISQSFAATEQTFAPNPLEIDNLRSAYVNAAANDVSVLAGSGDQGASGNLGNLACCYPYRVVAWPATDPLVTAVGGTQLHLDAEGNRTAPDNVWNDQALLGTAAASGGGSSIVFPRPSFQSGVANVVGSQRGIPDVSMSAAVNGAVDFFGSFKDYGNGGVPDDWNIVGGTSEATPEMAGIVALTDQAVGHSVGDLNPYLYSSPSGIVDVTLGNNTVTFCSAFCKTANPADTTVTGFDAGRGYDLASGVGTIDGAAFVHGAESALGTGT